MNRRFCDKCGVEEGSQRIVETQAGFHDDLPRIIDLCADCRRRLHDLLDAWLTEEAAA